MYENVLKVKLISIYYFTIYKVIRKIISRYSFFHTILLNKLNSTEAITISILLHILKYFSSN